MSRNSVYILLGSNLEQPIKQLAIAKQLIATHLSKIIKWSSLYRSAAWGNTNQPHFINQIIKIYSQRKALDILKILKRIEEKMGRIRLEKWGTRIIDLDILYYGQDIICQKDLTIPHPHIADRLFTLIPLSEIAPRKKHPVTNLNAMEMIATCKDDLMVKKIK